MEFTSGGTDGPLFDFEACDIDGPNAYGSLLAVADALSVAQAFHEAGWRVRKSSWTDFQVQHTFAEIELRGGGEGPVGFSGCVAPDRVDDLLAAFAALSPSYNLEIYDEVGDLVAAYSTADG
ncbi:hypothetical protein [Actinospica robiniae]|uniref:hypothetical protein n=1 Tax=Actinospica robiniae TaxID=304901 RepID=UPI000402DB51|nr:hypothetical protein [Actinospica robiniae]